MRKPPWLDAIILLGIGVALAGCVKESALPGTVQDEAMKAGRSAESFPPADEDFFHDMDGGMALTPAEVKGRDMWIVWTGALLGVEALIRWQHPERGLLPPAAFLPMIENHPISVEIGEWVIETALAQIGAWKALGLDLPVSVNVGAYPLQQLDFAKRLAQVLFLLHI